MDQVKSKAGLNNKIKQFLIDNCWDMNEELDYMHKKYKDVSEDTKKTTNEVSCISKDERNWYEARKVADGRKIKLLSAEVKRQEAELIRYKNVPLSFPS